MSSEEVIERIELTEDYTPVDLLARSSDWIELSKWLAENCRGRVVYDPFDDKIRFEIREEALLFKLTWL